MSDRIEKTLDLKAPIERVWRAISDHVEFGQWFGVVMGGPFAVGQLAVGRITNPGYEHLKWEITVTRMEPPRVFAFTWHPFAIDPVVDYSAETPTLVTFRLDLTAEGTRLTLTESGFDALPDHRRDEAFRRNEGGWTAQMKNIAAHVA